MRRRAKGRASGGQSTLDSDELILLASRATARNEHRKAAELLQRVLRADPDNAKAYYMLGGLCAAAGQSMQAIQFMAEAVKLEPGWAAVRFQLGLLYLTTGQPGIARAVWEALDELDEDDPHRLFKSGMVHLSEDRLEPGVDDIERGIERNTENKAINREMARIVDKARQAHAASKADAAGDGAMT